MSEPGLAPAPGGDPWEEVPLGDVTVKVGSGITPMGGERVYRRGGRPFMRSQNVGWGTLLLDDVAFIDEATHATFAGTEIREDDVLFNITGASIGRCVLADRRVAGGNVNQHVCIIRTDATRLNPRFLSYFLLSDAGQRQIDSFQAGGNRQGLNFGQIRSFRVPLPPRGVQIAIADRLAEADELIVSLDRLITKRRAIKQGALQQLLTKQARLPGFNGAWTSKPLVSLLRNPVSDGPHLTPRFLNTGIPFLSVNNIADNRISWADLRYVSEEDHQEFSKKCKPQRNDILFGKAASVGKVALVETDAEFNVWSPIAVIRVGEQADPRFIYYQLQTAAVARQVELLTNSSSQGNIGMRDIERLSVAVPAKHEQAQIASVLADLDMEIEALEARRRKTAMVRQGMMQAVLRGRGGHRSARIGAEEIAA